MLENINPIVKILMDRDEMSLNEAKIFVKECKDRVSDGEDPEEILLDDLGLEPDYIFDLL